MDLGRGGGARGIGSVRTETRPRLWVGCRGPFGGVSPEQPRRGEPFTVGTCGPFVREFGVKGRRAEGPVATGSEDKEGFS